MKKKLALLLLLVAILAIATACDRDGGGGGAVDGRERVEFEWTFVYDWWNPPHGKAWGDDYITAHWSEMFNIFPTLTTPDVNATEVINLRFMADDMPDVLWMDRNPHNVELTRLGAFYSIDELIAFGYDNWYHDNVPASTQRHYSVDGVNYTIPNWVRMGTIGERGGATGGNDAWLITTRVHEAVGSPVLRTFEDLYAYAVAVRDANLTNHTGAPIIPVLFNGGPNFGQEFVGGIFMSMGGINAGWGGWYSVKPDGTFGSSWNNSLWRAAVMEANRWHREGLFTATNLTNTVEQFEENLIGGRGGLIWHDHSVDNDINYRRILGTADPGNSIEVVYYRVNGHPYVFLPANGLPHSAINHQVHETLGWNGSFITRGASNPGRIFELLTWMLSPLGSIEMMFGPQGHLWDELNAQGYPILTRSVESLTEAENRALGLWDWSLHGHANNVDNAKFAANSMLPPEERVWVDYMQETIFTPNLRLSDEFMLMFAQIDSTSDLGIRRTMIEDRFEEMLPQIILASSYEEASRMFDEVRDFANNNGMPDIEAIYHANWEANKAQQSGSIFDLTNIPR